ncbi:MAG: hypothetical protein V1800_04915 [Candidatus Latescibacterota bacterium]
MTDQAPQQEGAVSSKSVDVGSRKQLFIDEAFFAETMGVRLTMNQPRKTDERTIIADKPWELGVGGSDTIIRMGDKYWYYYTTCLLPSPDRPVMFDGKVWQFPIWFMSLAISKDGICWEKPDLGLVAFDGSNHTNILFPPNIYSSRVGGSNHIFLDGCPGTPMEERYKAVFGWDGPNGDWPNGTWILKSADGLHWLPMMDRPIYRHSDTDNTVIWDERIGKYVFYFRDNSQHYEKEPICEEVEYANRKEILTNKAGRLAPHISGVRYRDRAFRKIRRFEIEDLRKMPELGQEWICDNSLVVAEADLKEAPGVDYDTNALQKYPWADNVYLMFPGMLRHLYYPPFTRQDPYPELEAELDAVCEVRLMTSRDGIHFATPSRWPFVPLGVAGSYDSGLTECCTGMVRSGADLYMYYISRHDSIRHGVVPHEYWKKTPPFISRLVMRLDGFVSVDAGNDGGEFTTVPMVFEGNTLALNVECSVAGYVIVELLRHGQAMDGFTFKDCDVVEGNSINKVVTWKGRSDLSAPQGQPIQMRFVMRNSKLYAFQFVAS